MRRVTWPLALLAASALACSVFSPARPGPSAVPPSAVPPASATVTAAATLTPDATATPIASPTVPPTQAASTTVAPSPTNTQAQTPTTEVEPSATPTGTEAGAGSQSFVAYVKQGQLLVTDVTGGAVGGTTQYTQAGVNDGVYDLVWSPSGQFIAFVSAGTNRDAHVYVVYAVGEGTPVDLGPGEQPNWSPDSARIAFVRDGNIWITPVDNPQPTALTNKQNWGWGRPTFTPAGDALVISGQPFDNMGAQGNTEFDLETLAPDGSGTMTPLPGMTAKIEGRLPYDLRFSPDGSKIAFSTSWHLSACASAGAFYVANADGSGMTQTNSRQLSALLQPNQDFYYIVQGYAWQPHSDGLLIASLVIDCTNFAGTHLGEALSSVPLSGNETVLAVGFFASPSYDRSGSLIAASQPDQQGGVGAVALYDAGGHPVATVGSGDLPTFQP
jgi:dipeptidyl aminopeptidase/acylaminoacyl peptidase